MEHGVSIGETLRLRREARGLSLEQAAFQGRVPLRLIQVLESDDYHLVPDALYLIRVLHDYARFLGHDPGEIEREFRAAIRRQTKAAPPPRRETPAQLSVSWRQIRWTGAAIVAVAPIVFIALSLSSQQAIPPIAPPPPDAADHDELAGAQSPLSASRETPPPDEVAVPATTPAPDRPVPEAAAESAPAERKRWRFLLVAEARELTWMAVQSDDGDSRQVLLRAGERARFAADRGFLLTVGNAGGVALSLNGERIPLLGRSGEVVRNLALPAAEARP